MFYWIYWPCFGSHYTLPHNKIIPGKISLHKECQVEEIPENRPLVIPTLLGTLVAQQSDTTLVAEYRDKDGPTMELG